MEGREAFVRAFPWPKEIVWVGDVGYLVLKSNDQPITVIISLDGHCNGDPSGGVMTIGTYNGFRVKVVGRNTGLLDERYFRFDAFMEVVMNGSEHVKGLCVLEHCGWHWYINTPKATKPFVTAIQKYIEQWPHTVKATATKWRSNP